jgi:hypothetical protein
MMQRLTKNPVACPTSQQARSFRFRWRYEKSLWILLLASTMMLSACGSSSGHGSLPPATLSGNWQFSMAEQINPDQGQPSFTGGLQGGFLLQNNGSVTGTAFYSVTLQPPLGSDGSPDVCSSGSAQITGTVSGQTVALTEVAGAQTFTFTGTLSLDGSTMAGSYTSTDGAGCGIATTQGWHAVLVPPLAGPISGTFHSTGGAAGLSNQDFPVTGQLTQGQNSGGAATVTGTLSFLNPLNNLSDYPCLSTASVSGQISGNSVVLQLLGSDKSNLGQIGATAGTTGIQPVTFDSTANGYILHSQVGPAYALTTKSCAGTPGDQGNICLGLGSTAACQQPITLFPAVITFPAQTLGTSAAQKITVTNTSVTILSGLTLAFTNNSGPGNFTVTADTCDIPGNPLGSTFALDPGLSCAITVTFTPQEASALSATLTVNSPVSPDNNTAFTVPITGTGVSAMAASTFGFDFCAASVLEACLPQWWFIGQGGYPMQTMASRRTLQNQELYVEID